MKESGTYIMLYEKVNLQGKSTLHGCICENGQGCVPCPFSYNLSNSSFKILFITCGLALPFVSFIACPTKKPKALSFPLL
jgi:hypothetical protein